MAVDRFAIALMNRQRGAMLVQVLAALESTGQSLQQPSRAARCLQGPLRVASAQSGQVIEARHRFALGRPTA